MRLKKAGLPVLVLGVGFAAVAKGQSVGVDEFVMVGPNNSPWLAPTTWSSGAVPNAASGYVVTGPNLLRVPSGTVSNFTGGSLLMDEGSTLSVDFGTTGGMLIASSSAPSLDFNNATLRFQRVGGTNSILKIDTELKMLGDNKIVTPNSGPLRVLFARPVTNSPGSLTIGPTAAPTSSQLLNFSSKVEVEKLVIGSPGLFGNNNNAVFSDLNAAGLEVWGGWTVMVPANDSISAAHVKLGAGTARLDINGMISGPMRLDLDGGTVRFGATAEPFPVIHDLQGSEFSSIRNLSGERALRIISNHATVFGGTFVDQVFEGFSVIKDGPETLTLTSESFLPGTLSIKGGRLKFGEGDLWGGIDWGRLELDAELEFTNTGATQYFGEVVGRGKMIQSGPEYTLLGGGASGFEGSVEVTGGRLDVNGMMPAAAIQVHGGVLGGVGTLGGVMVGSGGVLRPGNLSRALTIDSLTMAGSHVVSWSAATQMVGLLRVTGLLQLHDATLRFDALGGVGVLAGETHVIAEYGSLEGRFARVEDMPAGYRLAYGEGGNRIALVAIPEPGVTAGLAIGAVVVLAGRRRGGRPVERDGNA